MKIRTLDSFIKSHISVVINDYENIQMAVLFYLLRLINSNQYVKLTKSLPSNIRTKLRKDIKSSNNLRRLKLGILKLLQYKNISAEDKSIILKEYKLYKTDWNSVVLLFKQNKINEMREMIKGITIPSLKEVEAEFKEVILNIKNKYIKPLVMKKFPFLMKSQCLDADDFIEDLTITGLRQYNFCMPFKSRLHIENSMRTKIKTESNNIIEYYNKPKRARLIREGDNFISNTSSLNVMTENNEETDLLNRIGYTESSEKSVIIQKTADIILSKYMRPNSDNYGTKYEALNLLMERNSNKFVNWFNSYYIPKFQRSKKPCKTTEQVAKSFRRLDDYKEVIRRYFDATIASWNMFMNELKAFI